jgi:hypothetical protein
MVCPGWRWPGQPDDPLDPSIVNISLPTLEQYFSTNLATVGWVDLRYALILTSLILGADR